MLVEVRLRIIQFVDKVIQTEARRILLTHRTPVTTDAAVRAVTIYCTEERLITTQAIHTVQCDDTLRHISLMLLSGDGIPDVWQCDIHQPECTVAGSMPLDFGIS